MTAKTITNTGKNQKFSKVRDERRSHIIHEHSLKTCRIEVIKPIIEDKTANQVNCGCSRKCWVLVVTEIDLQFTKLSLRSVDVQ